MVNGIVKIAATAGGGAAARPPWGRARPFFVGAAAAAVAGVCLRVERF